MRMCPGSHSTNLNSPRLPSISHFELSSGATKESIHVSHPSGQPCGQSWHSCLFGSTMYCKPGVHTLLVNSGHGAGNGDQGLYLLYRACTAERLP
eukprot:1500160-Rhodomonas_salina.1